MFINCVLKEKNKFEATLWYTVLSVVSKLCFKYRCQKPYNHYAPSGQFWIMGVLPYSMHYNSSRVYYTLSGGVSTVTHQSWPLIPFLGQRAKLPNIQSPFNKVLLFIKQNLRWRCNYIVLYHISLMYFFNYNSFFATNLHLVDLQ